MTDIDSGETVWKEENPASPLSNRCLVVLKKEETAENIKPFYRSLEEDIKVGYSIRDFK